jgi:hypothetical protein
MKAYGKMFCAILFCGLALIGSGLVVTGHASTDVVGGSYTGSKCGATVTCVDLNCVDDSQDCYAQTTPCNGSNAVTTNCTSGGGGELWGMVRNCGQGCSLPQPCGGPCYTCS